MARVRVTSFGDGWYSVTNAIRRDLGLSIAECHHIVKQRNPDGTWTSGNMPDDAALRWGVAFEEAGCTVEVIS